MKGVEVIEKNIDVKDLKNGRVIVWKMPNKNDAPDMTLILNGKLYNLVPARFQTLKEIKKYYPFNGRYIEGIAKSTTGQVFIKERRK